jgi:accessory colonization factor AcfC
MSIRVFVVALALLSSLARSARAEEVVRAYGPGGPAPAMKEAAEAFSKARGVRVEITAGPTDKWIAQARADADVIFSGSEYMMTDFVKAMDGRIAEETIDALYMRPSAILVRPGNPRKIRDLPDLAKHGVKVLVVQGAGQTGMWEDMAGKDGDLGLVRALRKNIVFHAPNSAAAKEHWVQHADVDAWIIYNIWQVANPTLADLVPVSKRYVVYRDSGAALTRAGMERPIAREFVRFLHSKEGAAIFKRWGWIVPSR